METLVIGSQVGSGGFVRYVDHLGSDEKIVKCARVSTGRGFVSWDPYVRCAACARANRTTQLPGALYSDGCMFCDGSTEKVEKFPRGDNGIIHNLVRDGHTSPIEFGEIIYHLRIPMHIWRQVVRHRTANVSEYSTRYSEAIDEMETTAADAWRKQAVANRQGSSGTLDPVKGNILSVDERTFHRLAHDLYENRLRFGVAKEQARKDLPLSNYTEVYWKMDTHNLMHFLGLRLEEHAQLETRQFGAGISSIFRDLFPRLYDAFEEYKLFAVTFSRTEMKLLQEELMYPSVSGVMFETIARYLPNKADQDRFNRKFGR